MNCSKCGKEISEAENTVCEDCQKKILEEIEGETKQEEISKEEVEKEEKVDNKDVKKEKKKVLPKIIGLIIILSVLIAGYFLYNSGLISFKKVGNSIGNIRNFGSMAQIGKWIFFVNEEEKCIYKVDKNGNNKEIILEDNGEIFGLNVYKNKLYFITMQEKVELENEIDVVNNKICSMNLDGSDLKVINDNEFNNDTYEIYVVNNKIYYIGEDANIYRMSLEGENKEVINSDATGFIGITDKYILLNILDKDENGNSKLVTYSMNLDGEDKKALTGERLYSVGIVGDEVYYVNENKEINKVNIITGEKTEISKTTAYNMNISNNKIYFMNYDEDFNIAIYKMDLDGKNEEELLKLDGYSKFLNVDKNKILYIDVTNDKKFINLLDEKTKEKLILCEN